MVDHDFQIFPRCQFNQFLRLSCVAGEWLLDKNMFAILEGRFGQFIVRPDWRHNGDGIDVRRRHQAPPNRPSPGRQDRLLPPFVEPQHFCRTRQRLRFHPGGRGFGQRSAPSSRSPQLQILTSGCTLVAAAVAFSWEGLAILIIFSPEAKRGRKGFGGVIRLVCAVTENNCSRRAPKDLHVCPRGPVARVLQVQANHVIEFHLTASAHLPESRDPGLGLEQSSAMPDVIGLDFIRNWRAGAD